MKVTSGSSVGLGLAVKQELQQLKERRLPWVLTGQGVAELLSGAWDESVDDSWENEGVLNL